MAINLKDFKNLKDANIEKAKKKIDKIVVQAKDSLKVLESLQKEGLSMAKHLVELPVADKTKKFTNEKIVKNLHKLGLATTDEINELDKRLKELSAELKTHLSKKKKEH